MHSAIHTMFLVPETGEVVVKTSTGKGESSVPNFLLFELYIGIKDTILHLPVKRQLVKLHFVSEEGVFERFVAVVA